MQIGGGVSQMKNEECGMEIGSMITNFCDVAVGSRFEFRGKRYEKMNAQFGRDEERAGNLFHPRTEVIPMQKGPSGRPAWRMKNEGTKGTKRTEVISMQSAECR